ncbi:thioesterase, partial [Mycobacterium intermedium]
MADPEPDAPPSGRDVIAQFLPASPFVAKLGIVAERLEADGVRLRLPWDPSNVTVGDMVHGGAIATLADVTVMAAAWCGAQAPPDLRGVTVSMTLDFMAPARATDVIGIGRAVRGRPGGGDCAGAQVAPPGKLVGESLAPDKGGGRNPRLTR